MMENGLKENGDDTEEKEEEPYAERGRIMLVTRRETAQTLPYCQVGACKTAARKAQHAAKEHAVHCIGHRTEVHFAAQLHVPHHTVSFAHDHRTQTSVGEAPQKPSLAPPHFTPKRHPDTRQNPRWFQSNAPQHGGESSPPTPFEHKCMKRRKFPLPLQGETICLGTR